MSDETALVRREMAVIVPKTMSEMVDLAERIAKSSLLALALQGKVPETLMQIMAGQELGLYPMASLRGFDFFEGKPRMIADYMVAIVLGSGKAEYFKRVGEGSAKSVTYATKRRGQEEQRCTWTIEMAKEASLHLKDNWRGYPRAMLASRAKSELARDVYPDVLAGCYTPDEIGDGLISQSQRTEAIDAEFVDVPIAPELIQPLIADALTVVAIDDKNTVEELKAHAAVIKGLGLTGAAKDRATKRYNERMAVLKARPTSSVSSSAADQTPTNSDGLSSASTAGEA